MLCHSQRHSGCQNNFVQYCMQSDKLNHSLETTRTNVHYHFGADREIRLCVHLEIFSLRYRVISHTQVHIGRWIRPILHQRSANTDPHAVTTIFNHYLQQFQTWNTKQTHTTHTQQKLDHSFILYRYTYLGYYFVRVCGGICPSTKGFKAQSRCNTAPNLEQLHLTTHSTARKVFAQPLHGQNCDKTPHSYGWHEWRHRIR